VRDPRLRDSLIAGAKAQCLRYGWPEIARQCASLYQEVLQGSASS
jgi:hypothetical protein